MTTSTTTSTLESQDVVGLVQSLYRSRRFVGTGERNENRYEWRGPLVDLVVELVEAASARGLHVYRYQSGHRRSAFVVTITWVVTTTYPRPAYSRNCEGDLRVTLDALEGSSTRCAAYDELAELLARVRGTH